MEQFLQGPGVMAAAILTGAALELDNYFIGMTLISQPVIAGGLAGLIFGDPVTGILLGSMVQFIWISPPVGAYVPPSSTAIAFISTGLSIELLKSMPAAAVEPEQVMMFCLCVGAAAGYLTGQMDIWNRQLNTKIVRMLEPGILAGKVQYIMRAQVLSIGAKFARDIVLYLMFLFFGAGLAETIYRTMPEQVLKGLELAFWVTPAVGFAVLFENFRTKMGMYFHGVVFVLTGLLMLTYKNINPYLLLLAVVTACALAVYNYVWNGQGE
ncbi:MAG: PTS sugar transporter subunit IIC [Spirochaetia bacterium]|nr:PTS sugar transporter subunit IIC [Spirochaetia bacterium]